MVVLFWLLGGFGAFGFFLELQAKQIGSVTIILTSWAQPYPYLRVYIQH